MMPAIILTIIRNENKTHKKIAKRKTYNINEVFYFSKIINDRKGTINIIGIQIKIIYTRKSGENTYAILKKKKNQHQVKYIQQSHHG